MNKKDQASVYEIIDEPQPSVLAAYIVNPVVILFFSIFLPLVWEPPFFGRFWIPLGWLCLNGYFLGSTTLKKEVVFSLMGLIVLALIALIFSKIKIQGLPQDSIHAYFRIISSGVFFFAVYLVVFVQSKSYEIHKYLYQEKPT